MIKTRNARALLLDTTPHPGSVACSVMDKDKDNLLNLDQLVVSDHSCLEFDIGSWIRKQLPLCAVVLDDDRSWRLN